MRELAPVAVSVRSSLAVSLRMRPTLMARTPRASAMPNTVAQFTISADVGSSFFDSMLRSPEAASELALVSWGCVIGLSARIVQPSEAVLARQVQPVQPALGDHRVRSRRARRQLALLLHHRVGEALIGRALVVIVPAGPSPDCRRPLATAAEGELHARAGQSGPRAEDVDVGRDRRRVDAVGPQERRCRHVDRAVPLPARCARVLQPDRRVVELDDVRRADRGGDGVDGRHLRRHARGAAPSPPGARSARREVGSRRRRAYTFIVFAAMFGPT